MTAKWKVLQDPEHGARWDSLRGPSGREWLWSRPDRLRYGVVPGQPFVDVGGLEECFPTIGGEPDHGEVWARSWRESLGDGWLSCEAPAGRLNRRVSASARGVACDYRLDAEAARPFVWAMHLLLTPDVGVQMEAPDGAAMLAFPAHGPAVPAQWPTFEDLDFSVLGEDDGSAMFVLLPDLRTLTVRDGEDTLRITLDAPDEQPTGFGVWRNLGGYPWDGSPTYRNFGIEPMIGRDFDLFRALASPQPSQPMTGIVPASGHLEWSVHLAS